MRVEGLGFEAEGVCGQGFGVRVQGAGYRVQGWRCTGVRRSKENVHPQDRRRTLSIDHVGSYGGAFSYDRGTPVGRAFGGVPGTAVPRRARIERLIDFCITRL